MKRKSDEFVLFPLKRNFSLCNRRNKRGVFRIGEQQLNSNFASTHTDNNTTLDLLCKRAAKSDNRNLKCTDAFRKQLKSLAEVADSLGYDLKLSLEPKNSQSAISSRLAEAMIKDYFCIVSVDIKSGKFTVYSSDGRYNEMTFQTEGENFFYHAENEMAQYVCEEDRAKFIYYFQEQRLLRELDKTETVSFVFRFMIKGAPISVKAKITKTDENHMIIGVSDIDAQVKRRIEFEKAQEQRLTYSRIAQILARDYFSIYYVDINTDNFIEYSSQQKYKRLKIEQTGENFFSSCQKNILRVIHEDDRLRLGNALRKDVLISQTENGRSFSVSYRLIIKGEIVYVSLKAMRIKDEDGDHILIGVKNIDSQIRREQSFKKAIDKAQALAVKDALTNVKNKHAYSEAEKLLNERIARREDLEFAVIVCDINDLKAINDKYGHKAGDESIKSACATVCDIFRASPVYRVGGDEFAVILQGADYYNRYELLSLLRANMRENRKDGRVIMACGMSEYSCNDKNVSAVFERADENMYADKKALKNRN